MPRRPAVLVALVAIGCLAGAGIWSTIVGDDPGLVWPDGGADAVASAEGRLAESEAASGAPVDTEFGAPLEPAAGIPRSEAIVPPATLRLPTIGVEDAPVVDVGVAYDGSMEIPGAEQVGWYRYGATPGAEGSAVLAAHIAAEGVDGVFRDLDDLDPGDAFEVVDEDGVARSYLVVGVEEYEKARLPGDALFDEDGPPRLTLITCGGDFNPGLGRYDSNVVAYALPAEGPVLERVAAQYDPATAIERWGQLDVG